MTEPMSRKNTRDLIDKLINDHLQAFLELNDDVSKPFRVWARARKAALANARNGNMYYAFIKLQEMKEHGNALSQNLPDDFKEVKEFVVRQFQFIRFVVKARFEALGKIIIKDDGAAEFIGKTIVDWVRFENTLRSLEIIT